VQQGWRGQTLCFIWLNFSFTKGADLRVQRLQTLAQNSMRTFPITSLKPKLLVTKCYKMLQNATKCYKMLQNVTKCYKNLVSEVILKEKLRHFKVDRRISEKWMQLFKHLLIAYLKNGCNFLNISWSHIWKMDATFQKISWSHIWKMDATFQKISWSHICNFSKNLLIAYLKNGCNFSKNLLIAYLKNGCNFLNISWSHIWKMDATFQ